MNNFLMLIIVCGLGLGLTSGCSKQKPNLINESRPAEQYICKDVGGAPEPRTVEEYIKRGEEHNLMGEIDCAIGAFSEAIRLDPQNAKAYALRGYCYYRNREFDRGISDCNEAIRIDPNLAPAYIDRSTICREMGNIDQHISDLTEAIRIDPDQNVAYLRRGQAYESKGMYDNAISDYTEVIRIDPSDSSAYERRARVYHKMGKLDLALADEKRSAEGQGKALSDNAAEDGSPALKPMRLTGGALQANAIYKVEPVYPLLARSARASGQVVVEVTIDESGNVISAQAISGHPLLKDAAVNASRGWKFEPFLQSGQPVKTTGTLSFNFGS